ncbi:MAG: cellulase family glycosylhydrolase [Deltaproteobacteria bacterium]|nr:cellulase family glycosylhydrolase [Deltaproteobacteria bacterium]
MKLGLNISVVLASVLALLDSSAALAQGLQVQGPSIFYNGKPITLRGVGVGDVVSGRAKRPLSDYCTIAGDWNANVIRMGIHPGVWKHTDHKAVLLELKRNVDAALAEGMFVIIDWHVIGWPDGYSETPDEKWGSPADLYDSGFALAKDFWEQVSRSFGADSRILFELWNEPVASEDDWKPSSEPKWLALKTYWKQLLAIIRKTTSNVVIVAGNSWGYDLRGVRLAPLADVNVAYSWHVYAGKDRNKEEHWAAHLDELQKTRPVLVTEWGFDPSGEIADQDAQVNFGEKFVHDFLENQHLHSVAWCWHAKWSPAMLKPDWITPTSFGLFVRNYLRTPFSGSKP